MRRAVVDLPLPDSPTRATTCRRAMVKEASVSAWTKRGRNGLPTGKRLDKLRTSSTTSSCGFASVRSTGIVDVVGVVDVVDVVVIAVSLPQARPGAAYRRA